MKIIFLDIDGVLNTLDTYRRVKEMYLKENRRIIDIDEEKVNMLSQIVHETEANIVITSSWRIHLLDNNDFKKIELDKLFNKYGIYHYELTPFDKNRNRINEINEYINTHDIDNYIIIDDEDMEDFFQNKMIKTNIINGLTYDDVYKAINKLNRKVLLK